MNEQPDSNSDEVLNILCPMFVQFAAVAREGQVTKAATALGVPQPTVTRHLARLENVLGVRLYTRAQGGMTLTAEGKQLVKPVQQALGVLAAAIDDLQIHEARERVLLGFLHTLGEQAVPLLLRRFAEQAPQIKFSLVQDSADQLVRRLREGQVEMCLTSPLPDEPDIEVARLGQQRLVLAVPAAHVLAVEPEVPLAAAASDDFVTLGAGNHMRQMADNLCRAAGFDPRIAFEAAGISTLRGLVAAGLGVAIVPAAPEPVTGLVEVPLTDDGAYRQVGLAWRVDVELNAPAQRFRSFAADEFATALDESTGTAARQDTTTRGGHDDQSR